MIYSEFSFEIVGLNFFLFYKLSLKFKILFMAFVNSMGYILSI